MTTNVESAVQVTVLASPDDPLFVSLQAARPELSVTHWLPGSATNDLVTAEVLLGAPDLLAAALPHCPRLRWAQSTWAGVAPVLATPRRDYELTALKGVFGQAMSEYLLGWLLALERSVLRRAGARAWQPDIETGLAGKRLGILGTGSIGAAVAETARVFGLAVRGLNSDGRKVAGFDECFSTHQRLAFAEGLDYVFSVLPATPATNNLIDEQLLGALNPGAIIVNAGRGNVIDDDALVAAISRGQLRAAVLDVFRVEPLPDDHPFWQVENIYITSHTAAPTDIDVAIGVFLDNLQRFEAGQPLRHQVDFDKGY